VDGSLLDSVLQSTVAAAQAAATGVSRFLAAPSTARALVEWLQLAPDAKVPSRQEIRTRIVRDIAAIDALLSRQVDALLHHRQVQALESSWRGLDYLVRQLDAAEGVKVRVLDVSWRDLVRDLGKAIEFDQSQLFRKVYNAEFGTPGGEPYGLLIGDYSIRHRPDADHPTDDVRALQSIAQVAAAAFAPFVAAADPSLLGLDGFADLERPIDLSRAFAAAEFIPWNSLRAGADSRFVGLCLPRVLMRRPWRSDPRRADGFCYAEDVSARDRSGYLFGNPAWMFAAVVIRAFGESGWPAAIRGVERDRVSGGLVDDLATEPFTTDSTPLVFKPSLEIAVTDAQEKELSDLGLIPLCHCHGTDVAAFYANPSLQKPAEYGESVATVNAKLSSMLQYMLCVSRFAHFLKVIARDRVGSFSTAEEWERLLDGWLKKYTTGNPDSSAEVLARHPLREGSAKVREIDGRPGSYHCVIHLCPHFQLDQMASSIRLETELFNTPRF
jgi:type VI secretion system ImpC/EvpB family protein